MEHIQGRAEGARAEKRGGTFTGEVWGDPLMATKDGVTMNTVYFAPSGRTHWHRHEGGQVIHVSSGEGWVAQRGEAATHVRKGDTVWAPPGEEHWHGASDGAFLVHVAVSMGQTTWLDEVSDEDFRQAGQRAPEIDGVEAERPGS
jgi:quercetin dioxygenase-like cupin family protein